jgi:predicted nucleic acid-binding protein
MKVVIDTDILSMFAKVDGIGILMDFFGSGRAVMTPSIRDEISIPLQYGYAFPNSVLSQIHVIPLSGQAWEEHERLRTIGASLGKGELEAVAICKTEGMLFATNDVIARKFAQDQGVQVISLQAILRGIWQSGLRSKAEVRELLERVRKADNLEVAPEVEIEIFGEGEE